MNRVRKIVKNTGASFVARLASPASSFILVLFIARFLNVSGLGKYSAVLALLFIFQAVVSLGFPYLVTREVARNRSLACKYLTNASLLGFLISVGVAGIMCIAVHLISKDKETIWAAYVLSISLVPYALSLVCQSICRGFERLEYITIPLVIGNTVKVLLGIYVLFQGYGLVELMNIIMAHHFLIFFISLCYALKCVRNSNQNFQGINFRFLRKMITDMPVFALIAILSTVRFNIDILILSRMLGETEVGFYSAAYKLMYVGMHGIACYIMALQPVIFRSYKTSLETFERLCVQSVRYFLILILPVITGAMVLSDQFIILIYQDAFLPSARLFSILIWLLLLTGFNQILSNALIASDRQKINLQANMVGLICSISLNLLLIHLLRVSGAAWAAVSAASATFVFQQFFVAKYLFSASYIRLAVKPIIASLIMAGTVIFIKNFNLLAVIFAGATVYVAVLIILKTFNEYDKKLLKELVSGKRD